MSVPARLPFATGCGCPPSKVKVPENNSMSRHRLVVVGAGPAGMSAAIAAARAGLPSLLLDENPQPGGQIYRRPPPTLASHPVASPAGQDLFQALQELRNQIDLRTE